EQDDGAHDGHEEAGGMKRRAGLRLVDEPSDEAADHGAHDADNGRRDEPHLISPGRHGTRDETSDESHDDGPDQGGHRSPPFGSPSATAHPTRLSKDFWELLTVLRRRATIRHRRAIEGSVSAVLSEGRRACRSWSSARRASSVPDSSDAS